MSTPLIYTASPAVFSSIADHRYLASWAGWASPPNGKNNPCESDFLGLRLTSQTSTRKGIQLLGIVTCNSVLGNL